MRMTGLLGLIIALAIVGILVKKNLTQTQDSAQKALSTIAPNNSNKENKPQTVRQQSKQIQKEYNDALNSALQQGARREVD